MEAAPLFGHNTPEELQAAEAQFHNLLHLHKKKDQEIDAKKAELKDLNQERKEIRRKLADAGYPNALIDEIIEDRGKTRVDLQRREEVRAVMREWAGLPNSPQNPDLFETTPEHVRSELDWEAVGYAAGVAGEDFETPEGCPPEFHKAFGDGYSKGQDRLFWANDQMVKAQKALDEEKRAAEQRTADEEADRIEREDSGDDEDEDAPAPGTAVH